MRITAEPFRLISVYPCIQLVMIFSSSLLYFRIKCIKYAIILLDLWYCFQRHNTAYPTLRFIFFSSNNPIPFLSFFYMRGVSIWQEVSRTYSLIGAYSLAYHSFIVTVMAHFQVLSGTIEGEMPQPRRSLIGACSQNFN